MLRIAGIIITMRHYQKKVLLLVSSTLSLEPTFRPFHWSKGINTTLNTANSIADRQNREIGESNGDRL